MTILIPAPTGYGGVRHVAVTLPRVDFLVAEQPAKYALPACPAPTGPEVPPRRGARLDQPRQFQADQQKAGLGGGANAPGNGQAWPRHRRGQDSRTAR